MKVVDSIIAGYLIIQALAGTATAVSMQQMTTTNGLYFAPIYGLAALALVAGVGSFMNKTWARWLGVFVFVIQIVEIATPDWGYRLFLAFRFALSFGWTEQVEIGINLLALIAFIIACQRATSSNKQRT